VRGPEEESLELTDEMKGRRPFDIFQHMERAEWDTLMFFYGVILAASIYAHILINGAG
jgi:hypothetical protein